MDVLGRRNGAEKRKWTSGESQVNSIHNVGFIVSSRKAHSACPCRTGHVAQSLTCMATIANLTADPGVASSIPAWSHTFVEVGHEIISTVILLPSVIPLNHYELQGLLSVTSESMCTNYWITSCSSLSRKKCG